MYISLVVYIVKTVHAMISGRCLQAPSKESIDLFAQKK